ncbi:PAS domain S-box protein [Asticcacaulis solisilvae]|uniref:PAS domain S-box protein n=1 Tax=Asticcacaulis solisilvae TaxID=1217274 RepID=UPI003FD6CD88
MTFADRIAAYGGETGRLIADFDWSRTSLGPISSWPQSLKSAVSIVLRSDVAMVMLWNEDGVMLYNDAYSVFAGGRHPQLLGSKVREGWAEVADFNDHVMKVGLAGGTLKFKDQELTLFRNGAGEQVWMDLDYSPLPGDDGEPAGVLAIVVETTQRVQAEQALRESQMQLNLGLSAGRMSVWSRDFATGIITRSDNSDAILGEGLTYDEFQTRIPEPDNSANRALVEDVVSGRAERYDREFRYNHPDGRLVWLHNQGFVVRGDDGSPLRMHGVCIDVTDRRAGEMALRDSEAQLRALAETLPALVFITDAQGNNVYTSGRYQDFTGLPSEALLGDGWMAALHPEDRERAARVWEASWRTGAPYQTEYRFRRSDGTFRWHAVRGAPVYDGAKIIRWVGACTDIHAHKLAEAELHTANTRLESEVEQRTRERNRMFELSNDLFAVVGFDAMLKTINPAWSRLLGYDEDELMAQPVLDLVHPEDLDRSIETLALLSAGGIVQHYEERLRRADGSYARIAWAAVPGDGVVYAVGRDVTQERVREDALRQAQKMEAVGQLTGGIAHDFNNLLGAVLGSFDLIRRRPDDVERVRRFAESGMQAAERGTRLTGQLLAFSRAQRIENKLLHVASVVHGMRDMLARALGPMIRLGFELDTGSVPVLSDPTQLEMAVLNLAINSRDAMPDGGTLIIATAVRHIRHDPELKRGDYVELTVTDTGAGMTPDVAVRALDPFFTTKGVGKGTGLGLSQVYGIARQAGGTVRIESAPGTGTTVRVFLPRAEGEVTDGDTTASDVLAPAPASLSVLVVDDDPDLRHTLTGALDVLGFEPWEAADGPSGLEVLKTRRPDVLLVDFAMPGMNGAEVALAARALYPDLPILFASGYADTAAIERVLGEDATVLRKPFRIDELQGALTGVLRSASRELS